MRKNCKKSMDVISLCVIDWRLVEIVLYILCFATAHQQNFIFLNYF